jgi:hypothetical protein
MSVHGALARLRVDECLQRVTAFEPTLLPIVVGHVAYKIDDDPYARAKALAADKGPDVQGHRVGWQGRGAVPRDHLSIFALLIVRKAHRGRVKGETSGR